jgi:asparagine synthetase B (glutamine-hydrolysing)
VYYTRRNNHVLFASEVKALTTGMAWVDVDKRRLIEWFVYRNIDALSPDTLVEGVSAVMPGCVVRVTSDDVVSNQVYRLASQVSPAECRRLAALPPPQVVDEVDRTLTEAVRLRLVSDVAGRHAPERRSRLESRHRARRQGNQDLTAFNVSVTGYADLDERRYAESLARKLGIAFVACDFTADVFRRELVHAVYLSDFPLSHPQLDRVFISSAGWRGRRASSSLLSGEGADELFGGYAWAYRRRWYLERLRPLVREGAGADCGASRRSSPSPTSTCRSPAPRSATCCRPRSISSTATSA